MEEKKNLETSLDPEEVSDNDNKYYCISCGDELTYSGRGKPPSYCAKHKRGAGTNNVVSKGVNSVSPEAVALGILSLSTLITGLAIGAENILTGSAPKHLSDDDKKIWKEEYNRINLTKEEAEIIAKSIFPYLAKNSFIIKHGEKIAGVTNFFPLYEVLYNYSSRLHEASLIKKGVKNAKQG